MLDIVDLQRPHERPAFVQLPTSSTVVSPFSLIALTIVPFDTPLQPQTRSSSAIEATSPSAPASQPEDRMETLVIPLTSSFFLIMPNNLVLSAVSPKRTTPAILLS